MPPSAVANPAALAVGARPLAAGKRHRSRVGSAAARWPEGRPRLLSGRADRRRKAASRPACRLHAARGFPVLPGRKRQLGSQGKMSLRRDGSQFETTPLRCPAPLRESPVADQAINLRQHVGSSAAEAAGRLPPNWAATVQSIMKTRRAISPAGSRRPSSAGTPDRPALPPAPCNSPTAPWILPAF